MLQKLKRIAVLGYSANHDRPSNHVTAYMHEAGYQMVGVNPVGGADRGGDVAVTPSLKAAESLFGGAIDIVNVFRKSDALPDVLADVDGLTTKPACVWLQEGVTHPAVEEALRSRGIVVVSNRCLLKEHRRLMTLESAL